MSMCIFINRPPYKNYSTCFQESHLGLWLPFLFVCVVNIRKTRAVLYCQFHETLNHTKFSKTLGNKGKLQVSSCRCLLRQNDPRDEYLGYIFYRTAPIPQWRALDQTLSSLVFLACAMSLSCQFCREDILGNRLFFKK